MKEYLSDIEIDPKAMLVAKGDDTRIVRINAGKKNIEMTFDEFSKKLGF